MPSIEWSERRVELGIGLLGRQALGQRAREAGDHALLPRQAGIGLVTRITARQRHDLQHARMRHEFLVEIVHLRQRELQHHLLVGRQLVQLRQDLGLQQFLGAGLVRGMDVHLRLDDGGEAVAEDLLCHLELLRDHRTDSLRIGLLDDRTFLGAEDALGPGLDQQLVPASAWASSAARHWPRPRGPCRSSGRAPPAFWSTGTRRWACPGCPGPWWPRTGWPRQCGYHRRTGW